MQNFTVTDTASESNINYIGNTIGEILASTSGHLKTFEIGEGAGIMLSLNPRYSDFIIEEIKDRIADVIAVSYKYDMFSAKIRPSGISEYQRQILLTTIIAADIEEDKRYVKSKLCVSEENSIQGIFNFKMKALKDKWEEIASFLPSYFTSELYKNFISYMLEDFNEGKVYVLEGKVFDDRYNRLRKSCLLGGEGSPVIKEILLSKSREVELMSKIGESEENFLKEFYGKKVIFQNNYFRSGDNAQHL